MFESFRRALKHLEKRLTPKDVVHEVILQPSRIESDAERTVVQVCRDADGALHLIFRTDDETRLGVRVTKDTLSRLRELIEITERAIADTQAAQQ
jgi:hypothetical protein